MSKIQSIGESLTIEIIEDKIALVTMDIIGENQNTLRSEFANDFNQAIDQIEDLELSAVIIRSGKKDSFIVGADIKLLQGLSNEEEVLQVTQAGYETFERLEQFNIPVVAEIHGTCMGGGLELTLACHGRVCSDHKSTILALPEVQLGLLPGGGGTQRLPELIGIANALAMMTTGKNIRAKQALKMGLVDRVAHQHYLRKASLQSIVQLKKKLKKQSNRDEGFDVSSLLSVKGWQTLLLERNQIGLNFLFQQARKQVLSKTHGNYPAPEKIIDCVEAWTSGEPEYGYKTEAKLFSELVLSAEAKQLIGLFFSVTELKKDPIVADNDKAGDIQHVGVLGGGLMGAGIALVTANKVGCEVRLKDIDEAGLNHALKYSWDYFTKARKRRHMTRQQALKKMSLISAGTDYSALAKSDLIIEAVFESLELKQKMVTEIEKTCSKNTIFASNTSSIPISSIGKPCSL